MEPDSIVPPPPNKKAKKGAANKAPQIRWTETMITALLGFNKGKSTNRILYVVNLAHLITCFVFVALYKKLSSRVEK
jgi:hypothetical protein